MTAIASCLPYLSSVDKLRGLRVDLRDDLDLGAQLDLVAQGAQQVPLLFFGEWLDDL